MITDLNTEKMNRAKDIIEDFMIAANGVAARFLAPPKSLPCAAWCACPNAGIGIVELAAEHGMKLPTEPDAKALEQFLAAAKTRRSRCAFPIFPPASSNCWVRVSMSSSFREAASPVTSASPSKTTPTPPRPIVDFPT